MYKNIISVTMNILNSMRGAVSTADYPFIVLPVLLLQWAEVKNNVEGFDAYKEIYSPGRLAATYGLTDGTRQVMEYLLQIEEKQGKVYGGYIREVSSVLEKVSDKDFSAVLREVFNAKLSTFEEISCFAKEFIIYASKRAGRTTSLVLSASGVRQIERIASGRTVEEDTVFDGFAGSGISAITAASGSGSMTLQEINVKTACIAEMLCIINNCKVRINVKDSLLDWDGEEKYYKVLTEPPFGIRRPELKEKDLPYYSPDSDIMCIKHALSKITDNGVAVVLCPAGVLFRGGKTGTDREELIRLKYIDTIIQLPQGSCLGTGVSTAILVLRRNKKDDNILFIDASKMLEAEDKEKTDLILNQQNECILRNIIDGRTEVEGLSRLVSIQEIEEHEFSLVINQYLNKVAVKHEKIDIKPLSKKSGELMHKITNIDKERKHIRGKYIV